VLATKLAAVKEEIARRVGVLDERNRRECQLQRSEEQRLSECVTSAARGRFPWTPELLGILFHLIRVNRSHLDSTTWIKTIDQFFRHPTLLKLPTAQAHKIPQVSGRNEHAAIRPFKERYRMTLREVQEHPYQGELELDDHFKFLKYQVDVISAEIAEKVAEKKASDALCAAAIPYF
jgi:hypothetical protein